MRTLKIPKKIGSRGKLKEKSCDFQEKAAFIFCVEDRALFCRDCDESIHIPGTLSGQHQRLLATGIRVALNCGQTDRLTEKSLTDPPVNAVPGKSPSDFAPSAWAVDEFLQLSDYESGDKASFRTSRDPNLLE